MENPRENVPPAAAPLPATALLIAAALLALLLLCRLSGAADRGFDFTDEAFDLIVIAAPERYPALPTLFGFFFHPLHRAVDGNIAALRLANFAATYLLGCLFFWSLLAWKFRGDRLSRLQRAAAVLALSATSLTLFSNWMVVPSYNGLAQAGTLLFAASTLRLFAAPNRLELPALCGIGIGGWVVFMGKPPSAVVLALALLALLVACHPRWLRAVLIGGTAASALLLATALQLDGSVSAFAQRLLHAARLAGSMDHRHSMGGIFRLVLPRFDAGVVFFAVMGALLGLALCAGSAPTGGRRWWRGGAMATLLGFCLLSLWGMDGWPIGGTPVKGIVLLAPLLTSGLLLRLDAARTVQRPESNPSRRRVARGLTIFLGFLPWVYAAGTNNNPWQNMGFTGCFWVAAAVMLISEQDEAPAARTAIGPAVALAGVTVVAVAASVGLVMSGMHHPYRLTGPLSEQVQPTVVQGSLLLLSSETASYLREATAESRAAGLMRETPLLDLTGHSPGLVYALGARNPGDAWLIGGYPSSNRRSILGLQAVSCAELAASWLLLEPTGIRRLDEAAVLGSYGAVLARDYVQVAAWDAPAAPLWRPLAVEQQFYRPVRPAAEAEGACARVRAAGGLAAR